MAERYEIKTIRNTSDYHQRKPVWGIWDHKKKGWTVFVTLTKSQAEQVKKALDDATKQEVKQ